MNGLAMGGVLVGIGWGLAILGCRTVDSSAAPEPTSQHPLAMARSQGSAAEPLWLESPLPAQLAEARSAAMAVAVLAPIQNPVVARELGLHTRLFKCAAELEDERGGEPGLTLAAPMGVTWDDIALPQREYQLRILASLLDLDAAARWAQGPNAERTQLEIIILGRHDRGLRVEAEVGIRRRGGAGGVSRRQRVIAVWDGSGWIAQPGGVLLEW